MRCRTIFIAAACVIGIAVEPGVYGRPGGQGGDREAAGRSLGRRGHRLIFAREREVSSYVFIV